ncbi:hypothetical protein CPB83DRAFT_854988 [Crepidotus variabilis]|uniref:Uncharacterized protein n=1 Tax=Crepidotus variabilis TaxID=179855 RepID=A0A9P6JPG4_9AGAR|nr:hypothetical protein CPB83DRAFT_854988 [Crepidotus variabilis]
MKNVSIDSLSLIRDKTDNNATSPPDNVVAVHSVSLKYKRYCREMKLHIFAAILYKSSRLLGLIFTFALYFFLTRGDGIQACLWRRNRY